MSDKGDRQGSKGFRIEAEPPLVTFTICRPQVRNALSLECIGALGDLVEALEARPDFQVLIVASEGSEAFVAGGDVRQFASMRGEVSGRALSSQMGEILLKLEALPQVSIAAIGGDAYGGGVELALACDLRVMDRSSRLGFTQANFGLTSGWGGASRLVETVGYSRALDLFLNARVLEAEICAAWGLVNYVVDDGEALSTAQTMAVRVAALGRSLARGIKHVVRYASLMEREDAVAEEREVFSRLWASRHHEARVEAFLARAAAPTDIDREPDDG